MRTQSKRKTRLRRSASTPEPTTDNATQAEALPQPDVQPASSQADGSRVAFPTLADGTLDDEGIRSVTRERLRVVFLDPKLREKLGIDGPEPGAAPMVIPLAFLEKVADLFHDTLGKIAAVAAVKQGYPPDEAKKLFLTPEDKATLNPLAAQALSDWTPPIDSKYQSLALLGAGYIAVFSGKLPTLKKPADVLPFTRPEPVPQPAPEREP